MDVTLQAPAREAPMPPERNVSDRLSTGTGVRAFLIVFAKAMRARARVCVLVIG